MGRQNAGGLSELSVLAVDDHAVNRGFLSGVLDPRVASFHCASSGFEALELCSAHRFDLVLMDLHMPELDGLSTWQRILADAGPDECPRIIALTADCRPEERDRLERAGFHGFLAKPATAADLLGIIGKVMFGEQAAPGTNADDAARAALLDDRRALAAADNQPTLVAKLRLLLAGDLESQLPELDRHLAAGRRKEAMEILHQWSGASGYAGANRLEAASRALHRSLEHGLVSSPGQIYVHLINAARATMQAIAMDARAHRRA